MGSWGRSYSLGLSPAPWNLPSTSLSPFRADEALILGREGTHPLCGIISGWTRAGPRTGSPSGRQTSQSSCHLCWLLFQATLGNKRWDLLSGHLMSLPHLFKAQGLMNSQSRLDREGVGTLASIYCSGFRTSQDHRGPGDWLCLSADTPARPPVSSACPRSSPSPLPC